MMIALGSDHGGLELKQEIIKYLEENNISYKDFGTYTMDSCDYPDYAHAAAKAVQTGECEKGILVCSTGIGISIAANKHEGIRCALVHDILSAQLTRDHNNANMIALGGLIVGKGLAVKIVDTFLNTAFSGVDRHARRVSKIEEV
jgi:ribose 5-phosphate isomerase B